MGAKRGGVLALAACMALSCTGVTTSVEEARGPTSNAVAMAPSGASAAAKATATVQGDRVVGTLAWADGCVIEETTTVTRTEVTKKTDRSTGVLLTVTGGVLVVGGVVGLAVLAPSMSSEAGSCDKKDADGKPVLDASGKPVQESCASNRTVTVGISIASLALGALLGGIGVLNLAPEPTVTKKELGKDDRVTKGTAKVACGKATGLAGTVVTVKLGGEGTFKGTVDESGTFTIELPPGGGAGASASGAITIGEIAAEAGKVLPAGTTVGTVDLSSYVANAKPNALLAAKKAADAHEFSGVVHGDQVMRDAFTMACTPSGKDVCNDGIDNDCDGEYDLGCGYESGSLQWTLAWSSDDDLDLHVIGPDGEDVSNTHRKGGASGLAMDLDCAGVGCAGGGHVENVFLPRDRKPGDGTFRVVVEMHHAMASGDDAGRVVKATLGGRIGGRTFRVPISLQAQDGVRVMLAMAVGKDGDKDSVADADDACSGESGPWSEVSSERGCPDRDHDGVADKADACPDEAGIRTAQAGTSGCPRKYGLARLTSLGIEINGTILFDTGKATILPASYALLKDVATVMKKEPEALKTILVAGHTDNQGERNANMKLSRDRARSVVDWLVKKESIDASRLKDQWFGPDRPEADNGTDAGRAKNRRVEFRVVDPPTRAVASW